ncbi:MAG: anti-phage deoxyguanosine triphosphatase [Thalassobaculaceae bacterium]|nr:anti-phage deoxyguanosine triphosphatase [Thalassobaculaceae bacterium]
MNAGPEVFTERRHAEAPRAGDVRNAYDHDKGRVIHSAAFRRLQGKTQVMATGEGDFHRTRLTHSIECGQIGEGLLLKIHADASVSEAVKAWLPSSSLMIASCHAHDLGHPPYGHSGEETLNACMAGSGGFEGNGQTLRVLNRLEKYRSPGIGLNPTRRLNLAVLKYPASFSVCAAAFAALGLDADERPPKCYLDSEQDIVDWALAPFSNSDRDALPALDPTGRPIYRTIDCALMECADDIAYGVHDLEDAIARGLIRRDTFEAHVAASSDLPDFEGLKAQGLGLDRDALADALFSRSSYKRKQAISALVNVLVTHVTVCERPEFEHPLLRHTVDFAGPVKDLVRFLKAFVSQTVINSASVRQLRRKGNLVVSSLFDELVHDATMIPESARDDLLADDPIQRQVCDYIAGMTDTYAERLYRRMFVPGFGTTTDEL